MTDKIILVCVSVFLPLALVIINKLIDRTEVKQKDATIARLKQDISSYATEAENAQKAKDTAQASSQLISSLAQSMVKSSHSSAPLSEQAKSVASEADAIELGRRQVEAQK